MILSMGFMIFREDVTDLCVEVVGGDTRLRDCIDQRCGVALDIEPWLCSIVPAAPASQTMALA